MDPADEEEKYVSSSDEETVDYPIDDGNGYHDEKMDVEHPKPEHDQENEHHEIEQHQVEPEEHHPHDNNDTLDYGHFEPEEKFTIEHMNETSGNNDDEPDSEHNEQSEETEVEYFEIVADSAFSNDTHFDENLYDDDLRFSHHDEEEDQMEKRHVTHEDDRVDTLIPDYPCVSNEEQLERQMANDLHDADPIFCNEEEVLATTEHSTETTTEKMVQDQIEKEDHGATVEEVLAKAMETMKGLMRGGFAASIRGTRQVKMMDEPGMDEDDVDHSTMASPEHTTTAETLSTAATTTTSSASRPTTTRKPRKIDKERKSYTEPKRNHREGSSRRKKTPSYRKGNNAPTSF